MKTTAYRHFKCIKQQIVVIYYLIFIIPKDPRKIIGRKIIELDKVLFWHKFLKENRHDHTLSQNTNFVGLKNMG